MRTNCVFALSSILFSPFLIYSYGFDCIQILSEISDTFEYRQKILNPSDKIKFDVKRGRKENKQNLKVARVTVVY